MSAGLRIDRYRWSGGSEAMLRFGPDEGPTVVVAMPLFEEANRTRALLVLVLRGLATRGIAGALPDLPGQGESLLPTEATTLPALREAFAAATAAAAGDTPVHLASIRSGALLDHAAPAASRWRWSPQDGAALRRELFRIKGQKLGCDGHREDWFGGPEAAEPVSIAGNLIAPRLLDDLFAATLADAPAVPSRVVRLASDPRPADRHLPGASPWRRTEPAGDAELAGRLADDLADWVRSCGGC